MMWGVSLAWVFILALAQAMPPLSSLPDLRTHKEVKADLEIKASAGIVWHTLTDFPAYQIWNPYIYPATGEAVAGQQLDLTLRAGAVVHFTPTVLVAEQDRVLSWGGKVPVDGIERVVRFEIQALGPHRSRLIATEQLKGLLVPLAGVAGDSGGGLQQMARALRDRAELLDFSLPAPAKLLAPHP
jgi:hypothetical protein